MLNSLESELQSADSNEVVFERIETGTANEIRRIRLGKRKKKWDSDLSTLQSFFICYCGARFSLERVPKATAVVVPPPSVRGGEERTAKAE